MKMIIIRIIQNKDLVELRGIEPLTPRLPVLSWQMIPIMTECDYLLFLFDLSMSYDKSMMIDCD